MPEIEQSLTLQSDVKFATHRGHDREAKHSDMDLYSKRYQQHDDASCFRNMAIKIIKPRLHF